MLGHFVPRSNNHFDLNINHLPLPCCGGCETPIIDLKASPPEILCVLRETPIQCSYWHLIMSSFYRKAISFPTFISIQSSYYLLLFFASSPIIFHSSFPIYAIISYGPPLDGLLPHEHPPTLMTFLCIPLNLHFYWITYICNEIS